MTTMIAARAAVKGIKMTVEEQMDFRDQICNKVQEDIVIYFDANFPEWILRQEVVNDLCKIVRLRGDSTPIKEMHDA